MDGFVLAYDGFDPAGEGLREALTSTGIGYLCTRRGRSRAAGHHVSDVGQIYLLDNAFVEAPARCIRREAATARASGHEPGAQLEIRAPRSRDRPRWTRPRDRAWAWSGQARGLAYTWLENTYTDTYLVIMRDAAGCSACSSSPRFRRRPASRGAGGARFAP